MKLLLKKYYFLGFIALSTCLYNCTNIKNDIDPKATIVNPSNNYPTHRALRKALYERKKITIVYGAIDTKTENHYLHILNKTITNHNASNNTFKIIVKSASNITDVDITNNCLLLVGKPSNNPYIKTLSKNLPIDFATNQFSFDNQTFKAKSNTISLYNFPNPKNTSLPISIITGNDDASIINLLKRKIMSSKSRYSFYQSMDFEIYNNDNKVRIGKFDTNWNIDPKINFNFKTDNDTILTTTHYNFINHKANTTDITIETLALHIETTTQRILKFINSSKILKPINYHIYDTAENKALILGNSNQAHYNKKNNSVHTIINKKYTNNYIEQENNLIINQLLNPSKIEALTMGFPIYFTTNWQVKGYKYWAARLFISNNQLTLNELFDNNLIKKESNLVTGCMSGVLVDFLINHFGNNEFINKYQNWQPTKNEIKLLKPYWQKYLNEISKSIKTPNKKKLPNYIKGFNFAHEGYNIYNGYMSKKAAISLHKQAELGANAIAIVPYTFMRKSKNPTLDYLYFAKDAGNENDQSIIHTNYNAKQLKMASLLKPQIWFGNGWPGDLDFDTEAQWIQWFDYYYRWIRHYTLLAEIHDIPMLSLGVEFSIATLNHEKKWLNIIKKLRKLYTGQLTYCANWGKEFETISLWNTLDFIGLNSYYPLSDKNNPTDAELTSNFENVKAKIKTVYNTYQKPVVFTEIGFRSINTPWKEPHSKGDNTIFNDTDQDRMYKIIFKGIENESWCKGILWWKFPSYIEHRGKQNNGFTPNNKKTEQTIKYWFSKLN